LKLNIGCERVYFVVCL